MDVPHFQKLDVYILAKELVKDVYRLLKKFPDEERYALCAQLRRAAISVPSNIAEGMGRWSAKEQIHFIEIAYGSLAEVLSQMDIAKDLGYISDDDFHLILDRYSNISRMLSGLRKSIEVRLKNGTIGQPS